MSTDADIIANRLALIANNLYCALLERPPNAERLLGVHREVTQAANDLRTAFGLHPECSVCRRRHGDEVLHECE